MNIQSMNDVHKQFDFLLTICMTVGGLVEDFPAVRCQCGQCSANCFASSSPITGKLGKVRHFIAQLVLVVLLQISLLMMSVSNYELRKLL